MTRGGPDKRDAALGKVLNLSQHPISTAPINFDIVIRLLCHVPQI